MTRVCRQCSYYVLPDRKVENIGRCKLSKERFDREVKLPTEHPACKSFEDKLTGKRPGRQYQGVRRGR
jgi:hypothetical protein